MDERKYYDITHQEHVICNPTSEEKIEELVELLALPDQVQVLDIACGKGGFLLRLAEAYAARGNGIDISPYYLDQAEKNMKKRLPNAGISFIQTNGADYKPQKPNSLDVASCIGASWIFGGHKQTIEALIKMSKPGGWIIVGEPFWLQEPTEDYMKVFGFKREDLGSHYSNAICGEKLGLNLVYSIVSSKDDWDRYEGLQWLSAANYARNHPEDPDLDEMLKRVGREKEAFLRWGRDILGWAIYMFQSPATEYP